MAEGRRAVVSQTYKEEQTLAVPDIIDTQWSNVVLSDKSSFPIQKLDMGKSFQSSWGEIC